MKPVIKIIWRAAVTFVLATTIAPHAIVELSGRVKAGSAILVKTGR